MVFQAWKTVEVNKWCCAPLERDFLDPGPCCLPKNRSTRTTHTNRKSMDDVQELCRYYMNYTTLTCILCASSFNPQYSTYSINGRDRLFRKDRPFHSPHHRRPYSPRRWEGEYCTYLSTYVYFRTTRLLYHYEYSYVPSYPCVYCIESQHLNTQLPSSTQSTLNSEL